MLDAWTVHLIFKITQRTLIIFITETVCRKFCHLSFILVYCKFPVSQILNVTPIEHFLNWSKFTNNTEGWCIAWMQVRYIVDDWVSNQCTLCSLLLTNIFQQQNWWLCFEVSRFSIRFLGMYAQQTSNNRLRNYKESNHNRGICSGYYKLEQIFKI